MESLVNNATFLGLLIGSLIAGKLVSTSLGRIGVAKLANCAIILGCLPQLALNIYA